MVEEWWTLQRFPLLEFRDGVTGRRAGIRGGPDVWELMMVARDLGADVDALHDYFGGRIEREALGEALGYAERFRDEVRDRIRENDRIGEMLEAHSEG